MMKMPALDVKDSVSFIPAISSPPKSDIQTHVQLSPTHFSLDFKINRSCDVNQNIAVESVIKCRVNLFGTTTCAEDCIDDEVTEVENEIASPEPARDVQGPDMQTIEFLPCRDFRIACLQDKKSLKKLCAQAKLKYRGECYDDRVEYEVEYIIGDCVEDGEILYLVKWKNYPVSDASWEPAKNVVHCKALLQDYHQKSLFSARSLKNGQATHSTLQLFFKRVTRTGECDVPTLVKLCALIGKNVDLELPVTKSSLATLKKEAKAILEFGRYRLEKYKEDLVSIFEFHKRREVCLKKLKDWEDSINVVDSKAPPIRVVNDVDCEGPPKYTFIRDYIFHSVTHLSGPLLGCECTNCGGAESDCCPELAGEHFAYKDGRLILRQGYPIYECNTLCKCDQTCRNRVVQNGQKVKIEIFRTKNKRGWGLRTSERIKKNQFVLEYIGEIITSDEADQRRYGNQHSYLFDLDFENNACMYTVDAKDFGNAAHFINHSCNPNMHVFAVWINHLDPTLPRLAFFARRDIARGEELTFDYRMSKDTPFQAASPKKDAAPKMEISESEMPVTQSKVAPGSSKRIKCRCGTKNCRGYLF